MMKKTHLQAKIALLAILSLYFMTFLVQGVCTVELDKNTYFPLETATATMICTEGAETNRAYVVTWTNGTDTVETDIGVTPNGRDIPFFETLTIPSGSNWTNANVTLTGVNLEGIDYFNVTGAGTNNLIITDVIFTDEIFVGLEMGLDIELFDNNNKKVSNSHCVIHVEDGNDFPIFVTNSDKSADGSIAFSFNVDNTIFKEGRSYNAKIHCYCAVAATSMSCINEDGTEVAGSAGSASAPFDVDTWFEVNTITDKTIYNTQEIISICANITSNENLSERTHIDVLYNYRCGSGGDQDTDRIIYQEAKEHRGINQNLTQTQCHSFTIPNSELLELGGNICYASTEVSILNKKEEVIMIYTTTSPEFNITSENLHIEPDWFRIDDKTYVATINLTNYDLGTKNIHVIINELLEGNVQPSSSIESFTITYFNGSAITYDTNSFIHDHVLKINGDINFDKDIEISILNVNTSINESFNITLNNVGFKINNMGGNMSWLAIILSLGIMTVMFAVISFKIQDERLQWAKLLMFLLGVLNVFFMGLLPYLISINPNNASTFEPVGLAYLSVNGLLLVYFIWMYGTHLFLNVLRDQTEEQERKNNKDKM